jgi:hypothetical protein
MTYDPVSVTNAMQALFDRSFLPPKPLEFVVVSDTHYLLRPELQGGEWQSVREFPARGERALRLAGALEAAFCTHLGDVTHEYPETGRVGESREGAKAQFARYGLAPRIAAGNMDIGDKPDPTSPAEWVSPQTLSDWHAAFGPSWFSFDHGDIHNVVLNSVIMNGPLPEAEAQARWLEVDLASHSHTGRRIFLYMHIPPFFVDEGERASGMYNSLDDPARSWLLDLVRRHGVEAVFAGHTHFVALNRIGPTRFVIAPSTTVSRAGLPEAFTTTPPDRGRSDVDKLGFFLVRVDERGFSLHLIRTGREAPALDPADPRRLLVTCTSRDLPHSPVGVVATHPLGHMTPGPIIWPSVVRQRVRDDWRLFACLEMGARHVRVPESDLDDATERSRLPVLRDEGVSVTAYWVWSPAQAPTLPERAQAAALDNLLDEVEVLLPGEPNPDPMCLRQIRRLRESGLLVTLSTALRVPPGGTQYHGRTRVGYRPDELAALDAWLGRHETPVDRAVCRVYADDPPWQLVAAHLRELREPPALRHIGAVDLALDLPNTDTAAHAGLVAETLCAAAALPGARVWLGPLVDLDRDMDEVTGLLDRLSNPQPAQVVVRTLNSALFSSPPSEPYRAEPPFKCDAGRVLALVSGGSRSSLVLPNAAAQSGHELLVSHLRAAKHTGSLTCLHLAEGTSEAVGANAAALTAALQRAPGPTLLIRHA